MNINKKIILGLLSIGILFNGCATKYDTILEKNINNDDFANLETLLKKGVDPDTTNHNGYSMLYEAAYKGNLSATKLLVKYGADVNIEADNSSCSRTPLIEAIRYRHYNIALYLIEHGANLNDSDSCFERTPLHWIAYRGFSDDDLNNVQKIITYMKNHGVNFNQFDRDNDTPLQLALTTYTSQNVSKNVKLLVENGANPNLNTSDYNSPFVIALNTGKPPEVIVALQSGNIKMTNYSHLHLSSENNDNYTIDKIIIKYPSISEKILKFYRGDDKALDNIDNHTKKILLNKFTSNIKILLKHKHFTFVKRLYNISHIPNKTITNATTLYEAASNQQTYLVKKLIKNKKNIDKAVIKALKNENEVVIRELFKAGLDPEKKYLNLEYDFHGAFGKIDKYNNLSILQYLIIKYSYLDYDYNISYADQNIIKILLLNGANPNTYIPIKLIGGQENEYLIDIVFEHHNIKLTKLLLKYGLNGLNNKSKKHLLNKMVGSESIDYTEFTKKLLKDRVFSNEDLFQIYKIAIINKDKTIVNYIAHLGILKNLDDMTTIERKQKKAKAMLQKNIHKLFYSSWDVEEWKGKSDKQNWPEGKGIFTISQNDGNIWLYCKINTEVNNHKIGYGNLSCVIRKRAYILFSKNVSSIFKANFHGITEMNQKLIHSSNKAIDQYNGKIEKNTQSNSRCNTLYKTCMSYCDNKSTKGFFDDKSSCQDSCITGKNSCEEGDFNFDKIISCRGICKGVNNSNGSFFGWGASSFDKCVDNCTNEIGK